MNYREVNVDKVVFIRQHLIEKGVPTDLVYPWPFLWAKLFKSKGKPLVFQSPIKLFVLDALNESVIWGGIYVVYSLAFTPRGMANLCHFINCFWFEYGARYGLACTQSQEKTWSSWLGGMV